jgi:hypothetical protein
MGIKTGRFIITQESVWATNLDGLHRKIIGNTNAVESPQRKAVIAIDVSVWIQSAASNPHVDSIVSSQLHAEPMVPVTAPFDYCDKRCKLLQRNNFTPVVVVDGARNPLKEEENTARTRNDDEWTDEFLELYNMYQFPDDYSLNDVLVQRKRTIFPREDVIWEVINGLRQSGVCVVCGPFEADSQIVDLYNQGIIDAAISTDTDLIGQGVPYVIKSMDVQSGNVEVMDLHKLLTVALPNKIRDLFGNDDDIIPDIDVNDLRFLCNMFGTDYLRDGLRNSGWKDCLRRFWEYIDYADEDKKERYRENYADNHDTPDKFRKSFFAWKHSPAFLVIPNNSNISSREALFSNQYTVELGSMAGANHPQLYEPVEEKLGFHPHIQLRHGHPEHELDSDIPSLLDFFQLNCWSRTGKPFKRVEGQRNANGHEVFPGAIIDFDFVPVKHQPTRCLKLWLSARGIATDSIDTREELEQMVCQVHNYNTDALPRFVMRGGGGYVTNSIFKPNQGSNIAWKVSDEAIDAIRSDLFDGYEAILDSFFIDQFNSKRKRILSHLKTGSIPVEEIKVTTDLITDIMPGAQIIIIQCHCAPSQKGIGSEKKLYCVRLAFEVNESGSTDLLPAPFSICDCPVGVGPCAHKGAFVLVMYVIRDCFDTLDYAELLQHMPTNIHSVAKQLQLVHHLYPAPYTSEYGIQRDIKEEVKETTNSDDDDEESDQLDDVQLELRNVQERRTSAQSLIDMSDSVTKWCHLLKASLNRLGVVHRCDSSRNACEEAAKKETCEDYWRRFNIRARDYAAAVTADLGRYFSNDDDSSLLCLPPSQYGCFAEFYANNILESGGDSLGNLADHMLYPDHIVYPPGIEDEDDDDENDEEDSF